MARIAIVAAMFREVHPLVRTWQPMRYLPDRRVQLYQSDQAVVAYAGMGLNHASLACHAALASGEISAVLSVGWAGGLNPDASPGKVVHPSTVVNAATGKRYASGGTDGILVSAEVIVEPEEKRRLAELHDGDYVDMEAAAVADCAHAAGLPFYAIKAISDAHDERLPDLNRFNRNGQFKLWRFLAHVAIRPKLWSAIADMSWQSLSARDALCKELEKWIAEHATVVEIPNRSDS